MKQENWQKVKQIFYEAHALKPEERSAFLKKACSGDDLLKAQVNTLLSSYESGFLEETALQDAADLLAESEIKIGKFENSHFIVSEYIKGEAKPLTNFTTEQTFGFDLSPDGKQLAAIRGTQTSEGVFITRAK